MRPAQQSGELPAAPAALQGYGRAIQSAATEGSQVETVVSSGRGQEEGVAHGPHQPAGRIRAGGQSGDLL